MKKIISSFLVLLLSGSIVFAADLTKTVGVSSRDYTTGQLCEDDLDDGTNAANDATAYQAGDTATCEFYDDGDFTGGITINGGNTVGLTAVTFTAPSAERHTGSEATGVELDGTVTVDIPEGGSVTNLTVEWLDITEKSPGTNGQGVNFGDNTSPSTIKNNIVRDVTSGNSYNSALGIVNSYGVAGTNIHFLNNIVYNIKPTGSGSTGDATGISCGSSLANIYNNTVYKVENDNDYAIGIYISYDVAHNIKNNIATDTGGSGSGSIVDFDFAGTNPTADYNWSEDETADDGGGANDRVGADHSESGTDIFVSITGGSEILKLKAGGDPIDKGEDLGDVAAAVEITSRNRHDEDDDWDMGAHEFVGEAPSGRTRRFFKVY